MFRSCSLLLLLGLAACSGTNGKTSAPPPGEPPPERTVVHDAAVVAPGPVPARSRQLVVGITESWDAVNIELARFERDGAGAWQPVGTPWPATVGHAGLAWGAGLHGAGAPDAQPGPSKREGDGKSPAGAFDITEAFGYAPTSAARLPYTPATKAWRCVDDGASKHYTRILDETTVDVDWKSAEYMKRDDDLYEWVIVIAHNAGAVPGYGSCIFFHVWNAKQGASIGCTAMAKPAIESMLAWLDPAAHPVFVQLPRDAYIALQSDWQLPDATAP